MILKLAKRIRHRGPDWSGMDMDDQSVLAHERLAIVDPDGEAQPLYNEDKKIVLAVCESDKRVRERESVCFGFVL